MLIADKATPGGLESAEGKALNAAKTLARARVLLCFVFAFRWLCCVSGCFVAL